MEAANPLRTILSILIVMPLGFATKFYHGPGAGVVNGSVGDSLYVVFWCLVVRWFFPSVRSGKICLLVLLATCAIEFSQLWQLPFLQWIRSYFMGRIILGTTFDWEDFLWYFAGAGVGWLWLRKLHPDPKPA